MKIRPRPKAFAVVALGAAAGAAFGHVVIGAVLAAKAVVGLSLTARAKPVSPRENSMAASGAEEQL